MVGHIDSERSSSLCSLSRPCQTVEKMTQTNIAYIYLSYVICKLYRCECRFSCWYTSKAINPLLYCSSNKIIAMWNEKPGTDMSRNQLFFFNHWLVLFFKASRDGVALHRTLNYSRKGWKFARCPGCESGRIRVVCTIYCTHYMWFPKVHEVHKVSSSEKEKKKF